jgi:hypothetical protein
MASPRDDWGCPEAHCGLCSFPFAEADVILCRTPRFLILHDMKWDLSGPISSLYLHAIVCDPSLRSLRDFEVDRMATWACWRRYGRGRMAPPRDYWGCPEAHYGCTSITNVLLHVTLFVPIRGLVSLIVDRVDHFQGTYRASVAGCQDVWRLDRHICWKRSSQWCVDILGEVTLA